ncbi:MAG: hypothetical protein ABI569_13355, partial [Casimicrobiaceae bacterium]
EGFPVRCWNRGKANFRPAHVVAAVLLCWAGGTSAATEIDWWVVNRFPLFKSAADFERISSAWSKNGSAAETIDSPQFTAQLRSMLPIRDTAWNPTEGTYDTKVLFPERHSVKASLIGTPAGTNCEWSLDGHPATMSRCAESEPFLIASGARFVITATPVGGAPMSIDVPRITETLIVALGDSFASGEGNPDHPAVFHPVKARYDWFVEHDVSKVVAKSAAWWDEACHRSLLSWPALSALSRAVANRHEVVQFASFACTGAEVYDGVLRAQLQPPGDHAKYILPEGEGTRDGGPSYAFDLFRTIFETTHHDPRLRLSQQHALALLVCDDGTVSKQQVLKQPDPVAGITKNQSYFGEVELYGCKGRKREVAELLIAIGGNDVAFSGLVKWILFPDNTRLDLLSPLRQLGLYLARDNIEVVTPTDAEVGIDSLPRIYHSLAIMLTENGIPPNRVKLMQYADLTIGSPDLALCNRRTRDGNGTLQVITRERLFNTNFKFGINPVEFQQVGASFIAPLRKAQQAAANNAGWTLVDSQLSFETPDGIGRGYCAVAPECAKGKCAAGDLVRWWNDPEYTFSKTLPITPLNQFDPYDPGRARGLRYGVDALLAAAAIQEGTTQLRHDWYFGTVHPTANLHARLADRISALPH